MTKFKISPKEIKRVKALGFLQNKTSTDEFSGRILTGNGKVSPIDLANIARIASKYGKEVTLTSRLSFEVNGIRFDDIDNFIAELKEVGLKTGGTGNKMRPVVSCKDTTCKFGLINTFDLSQRINDTYFEGWSGVSLPHKFKVSVGGCPNSCMKPDINDFGITGQFIPTYDKKDCKSCKKCSVERACPTDCAVLNQESGKMEMNRAECIHCGRCLNACPFDCITGGKRGFKVTLGGLWGKRKFIGKPVQKFYEKEEDVLKALEKCILAYKEVGVNGERLHDTIERVGFKNFEQYILTDDILDRKDEILKQEAETIKSFANVH